MTRTDKSVPRCSAKKLESVDMEQVIGSANGNRTRLSRVILLCLIAISSTLNALPLAWHGHQSPWFDQVFRRCSVAGGVR
jgi:hypothetical protein